MTNKFDPSKPVQTRDGRKARILCTDYKSNLSTIVALVASNLWEGKEDLWFTDETGKKIGGVNPAGKHLINIPETHEVTIHLSQWPEGDYSICTGPPDPESSLRYIASKRITFTEGEFED